MGWSGATAMNDMPNSVSGRVVNTSILSSPGQGEPHPRALAPPDPPRLHRAHPLGPAIQRAVRQCREQGGCFLGDAEEPLRQPPLLDGGARPPAATVDHLLVGQHGAVHRVPIDEALAPEGQPGRQQIEEQFLLMAVIARVAARELARPVDRQAHALHLAAHGLDIGPGPDVGMDAAIPRRVLRRQAEGVPSHRVHDGEAARPLVARDHVAERVVADVPHVDFAARVGEHLEHVVFRRVAGRDVLDREAALSRPGCLPARLGSAEVETRGRLVGRGLYRGVRHRYLAAVCDRSSRARAKTLSSISPLVDVDTGASTQRPDWSTWRNTLTRMPSVRSCRPRM